MRWLSSGLRSLCIFRSVSSVLFAVFAMTVQCPVLAGNFLVMADSDRSTLQPESFGQHRLPTPVGTWNMRLLTIVVFLVCRVHGISLNEDQMKIVNYVSAKKRHLEAPLVVYGAFGTGKTESLAHSAILLTSCSDDVKLLICTQTNS